MNDTEWKNVEDELAPCWEPIWVYTEDGKIEFCIRKQSRPIDLYINGKKQIIRNDEEQYSSRYFTFEDGEIYDVTHWILIEKPTKCPSRKD